MTLAVIPKLKLNMNIISGFSGSFKTVIKFVYKLVLILAVVSKLPLKAFQI